MPTIFFDTFGGSHPPIKLADSKGEFSELQISTIRQAVTYLTELLEIAHAAAERVFSGDDHLYYLLEWFGKNDRETRTHVANKVRVLYAAFNDPSRFITFVNLRGKAFRKLKSTKKELLNNVKYPKLGLYEYDRIIKEVIVPDVVTGSVFTQPDINFTCLGHVGAGMRIYIGDSHKTVFDFALTILHELTHKILTTTDFYQGSGVYGSLQSMLLAKRNHEVAMEHADCWAWFICSLKHEGPYPYDPSDTCSESESLSDSDYAIIEDSDE